MAAFKVLYVSAGPAALAKVREIRINNVRGSFVGTGDGAITVHPGRSGASSGSVIAEDAETAQSILAADAADAVFVCKGDSGNVNVTVTKMVAHGQAGTIGDGTKQNDNVVGFEVQFIAQAIAIAAAGA